MDVFFEIHSDQPREGPGDNESTRKAYAFLKNLPNEPRILDIGCGPGMQTVELAKISNGHIVALDNHRPYLRQLKHLSQAEGVQNRIEALNISMFDMEFDEKSFDVIWSEGAIYFYGFEQGLIDWRPLLKKKGYMVVSEFVFPDSNPPEEAAKILREIYPEIKTNDEIINIIKKAKYRLITHFGLPESAWEQYFKPVEERVFILKEKYKENKEVMKVLNEELDEMEILRKYFGIHNYVFYVMQK